uniref:Uncharacterized protein n=1 Tax=Rhizophora mucronata TaxID=61149 RepID=A0A2P2NKH9_RHIMU
MILRKVMTPISVSRKVLHNFL